MEPHNGSLVSSLGPHHMRPPVLKRPLGTCTQCITFHSIPFHSPIESHHNNPNTIKLKPRTNHQKNRRPRSKRTGCDGAAAAEAHPTNCRHAYSPPPRDDARQCCTADKNNDDGSQPTPAEQIKATRGCACVRGRSGDAGGGARELGKRRIWAAERGPPFGHAMLVVAWLVRESTRDRRRGATTSLHRSAT
jgi:hypothetical protein